MKTILIIGATSGIGKSLAMYYAAKNYNVAITGRRQYLLNKIQDQYPNNIHTSVQDITQIENTDTILNSLFKKLNQIDIVIVCSGIGDLNPHLDWEIEQKVITTNILGISKVYEHVFHQFKKQTKGHLVGISSLAGLRGNRYCPSYSASKAFQINYLEGLRCISKNKKLNIVVTDIQPGFVDTAMAKGDDVFWVASIPKATKQIVRAIEKQKRKQIVSKRWNLISFFYKRIPNFMLEKM